MELKRTHAETVDAIIAAVGPDLRVGTPLGLGKPNQLINAIYDRVVATPELRLKIFTALSLEIPETHSGLEARFAQPFFNRHFGENYPALRYTHALRHHDLPERIEVREFYTSAGQYVGNPKAQQDYTSLNYTHAARAIANQGVNILVQIVARSADTKNLSLSCNTDLSLDLVDIVEQKGNRIFKVGVIHPDLPFLGGEAEISPDFFDIVLDTKELQQPLFALPRSQVSLTDHLIGLHASRTIKDGGTLQIGIGTLSDALVHATLIRHTDNETYLKAVTAYRAVPTISTAIGPSYEADLTKFQTGLYGTSEMVMDGFMHLRKAGILKRTVQDKGSSTNRYLHGGFFLGTKGFYEWLRDLNGDDYDGISMTRISKINDLYDADEISLRRQRVHARFFNTCAQATLLGEAASDTLPNGQVLSGVGGQYNFVAEAAELETSRSVLMFRSTRLQDGKLASNVVMGHPHVTIPRHLRDLYITEYGVADLKGRTDQECCEAMIEIADSRFQSQLIAQAQKAFKLRNDYVVPAHARNNTPAHLHRVMTANQFGAIFPQAPFGSEFSEVELSLQPALLALKASSPLRLALIFFRGLATLKHIYKAELERMDLFKASSLSERMYQRLLIGALALPR